MEFLKFLAIQFIHFVDQYIHVATTDKYRVVVFTAERDMVCFRNNFMDSGKHC